MTWGLMLDAKGSTDRHIKPSSKYPEIQINKVWKSQAHWPLRSWSYIRGDYKG